MDVTPPKATIDPGGQAQEDWRCEFRHRMEEVEIAAREWGLRSHEPEGRFVSALLGAVGMLGQIARANQGRIEEVVREGREAAAADLARARELSKAADLALRQSRQALIGLEVERENLVLRMIKETLPLFADRLKQALVIREQRWNSDLRRRRYATAGAVALAVFLGGYALRAWSESDRLAAFDRCLSHAQQVEGRYWCEVTAFQTDIPWAGK